MYTVPKELKWHQKCCANQLNERKKNNDRNIKN